MNIDAFTDHSRLQVSCTFT